MAPKPSVKPTMSQTKLTVRRNMAEKRVTRAPRTSQDIRKFLTPVNTCQQVTRATADGTFVLDESCKSALESAIKMIESGQQVSVPGEVRAKLSPKTLKNRKQYLKALRKAVPGSLLDAIMTPQRTVDVLTEQHREAPGTLCVILQTVMTIFREAGMDKQCKDLYNRWKQALVPSADAAKAHTAKPLAGGTQLYLDAVKKQQELYSDPQTRFGEDCLILSLFTLLPPRRAQDWGHVMVLSPDAAGPEPTTQQMADAGGVWDLSKAATEPAPLVMRRFKTAVSFQKQKEQSARHRGENEDVEPFSCAVDSPELLGVVHGSLKRRPRRWLFTMARMSKKSGAVKEQARRDSGDNRDGGVPYNDGDSFGAHVRARLGALLGQGCTLNKLRQSYALWVDEQRPSAEELQQVCDWMGHSVQTHVRLYLRRKPANTIPGVGCRHR